MVDPTNMRLEPTDPKLLGVYNFTIPALDKATGHVEEMLEVMSALIEDIPSLLPPPQAPAATFLNWEEGLRTSRAAIKSLRVQYPQM